MLMQATRSFFDQAAEPSVSRILLLDGPAVLGHEEWRRLDGEHFGGLVISALEMAMSSGAIRQQPLLPLSRIILGAIQSAAVDCAQQEDFDTAAIEYLSVFESILESLK
jgi:hypothetical protein